MVTVRVRAPVKATEAPERVVEAVHNLFPEAEVEVRDHEVEAQAPDLEGLRDAIRRHQIPDTAREVMLAGRRGASTSFALGKQAAYAGRPHFGAGHSPLGDLEVRVEAGDEEALLRAIYETAPDTTVEPEHRTVPPRFRPPEAPKDDPAKRPG
jgi:predicted RNA binding protein with dsRBD fold (UPF0201 family)